MSGINLERISPAEVYLNTLTTKKSRRTMGNALDAIARIIQDDDEATWKDVDWSLLRNHHTAQIRVILADKYKPRTTNRHLSALRGALREAWRLHQMTAEDYHRAIDFKNVYEDETKKGRIITQDEIQRLFDVCAERPHEMQGKRDMVILSMLFGCGLRRTELSELKISDYDPDDGSIYISLSKQNKSRTVYMPDGTIDILNEFLAYRAGFETLEDDWPLICHCHASVPQNQRSLGANGIYTFIQRLSSKAGVAPIAPHDFRRTYISNMLDRGVDIVTVSKMVGHKSIAQTAEYDRRTDAPKRRAAQTVNLPEVSNEL